MTTLESFQKHRTEVNGEAVDVYYDETPRGVVFHETVLTHSKRPIGLDMKTQNRVRREISGRFQ